MAQSSHHARLAALRLEAQSLSPTEVNTAINSGDILEIFRINSGAHFDASNVWPIDVFPNMIPIVTYVMLMSLRHANITPQRDFSKTSVATICMYHMTIVYGFFLLNDLRVRSTPSAHARSWQTSSWKAKFVSVLCNLPVPQFLEPILAQFHSVHTERTRNVIFVPCAAGFDHNQFFGRVFPINMFSEIHDCIATLPGNSNVISVYQDLFSRVLYNIEDPAFSCVIPDLIGVTIDRTTTTTVHYMNSKLYQVFTSVFNPVLFKDIQRRNSLAAISLAAPTFATANTNAYDLLFAATAGNLAELTVVLQAVQSIFPGNVPATKTLFQFITEASGSAILKHGYSTFALPVWSHNEGTDKVSTFKTFTTYSLVSEDARASDFCFLQRPTTALSAKTTVDDVTFAEGSSKAPATAPPSGYSIVRHKPFCLRLNSTGDSVFPKHDNNDFASFIQGVSATPPVLVLDTDGDLTVSAHLATLAGKIIESFELDGTTIEVPNADRPLGLLNSQFADSAIGYYLVRPGSDYHPCARGTYYPPLNRTSNSSTLRLPASTLLRNRTEVILPYINPAIVEAQVPTALPGLQVLNNVVSVRHSQSFIGFKTVDRTSNAAALDAIPGMVQGSLLVWSPYTYTPYEDGTSDDPDLGASRHYYLTNLRTIFGTDYKFVRVNHPFEAMPVI